MDPTHVAVQGGRPTVGKRWYRSTVEVDARRSAQDARVRARQRPSCSGWRCAPAAVGCPETSLGDLEDEVMCPVCGTSLGLATEAPQAQRERAFIQRPDRRVQDEGRDQGRARGRVRRRGARAPGRRRLRDRRLPDPAGDPARRRRGDRASASAAGAGAPASRAGRRRRRAATESKRLDDDLAKYDL